MQFGLLIKKMGYRGFQAKANSRKVRCEHHLVAGLFVCGKSGLAWDAGLPGRRKRVVVNTAVSRRPLRVCGDNLQRLKFLADLFRSRAEFTERSIFGAVGGIRCGNFAVIKGKHVKLKNFATPDLIIFILCIYMSLDIFVIRRIIYYEIL